MKILVTGATGFLGAALVERLLVRGARDLRLFVRPGGERQRLDALQARFADATIEYVTGTLTSPGDVARAVPGVDLVHHLAAGTSGAAADLFLHSVVASQHLLRALRREQETSRRRIPIVLASSFGVYGTAGLRRGQVVDETTPLEPHPERRDPYSQSKLRQERLFWDERAQHGQALTVLRPGVIYGPRGGALSGRVGLSLPGLFLHLGGDNLLPLAYVDNCAEALALAGDLLAGGAATVEGEAFNVHDDELPTCRAYLERYRREVKALRVLRLPLPLTRALATALRGYHEYSRGQLPAILTPYKVATTWKGTRFDNRKLKRIGWRAIVSTDEGIGRTFAALRARGGGP